MQEASDSSSSLNSISTTSTSSTPPATPSTPTTLSSPFSSTTEFAASTTPPFKVMPITFSALTPVSVPILEPTPPSPPVTITPTVPIDRVPDEKTPTPLQTAYELLNNAYPPKIPKHRRHREAYLRQLDRLKHQQQQTGLDGNALQKLNTLRKALESAVQQTSESIAPASSTPTTAPLTKTRFIEILDGYMQGQQDADELIALSPQGLYDLIIQEKEAPEKLVFRPVFMGMNLPDTSKPEQYKTPKETAAEQKGEKPVRKLQPFTDDSRRAYALSMVCAKLKEHKNGARLLKILLQTQIKDDTTVVLHVAAQRQYSIDVIQYLLQLAEALGMTNYVNILDNYNTGLGATPLYFAANDLQIDNMQVLLQQGANPLAKTRAGLSIYNVLVAQIGSMSISDAKNPKPSDQRIQTGAELLQQASPHIKRYSLYTRILKQLNTTATDPATPLNSIFVSNDDLLRHIINVKLLLDFAHTKATSLSAFIGFLQNLSILFAGDQPQQQELRNQFLTDFDAIQPQFLTAAAKGGLNGDLAEQSEILATASWLMSEKRYSAALSLFRRLLSDKSSLFLKDKGQVYKILRWAAMCIGKIHHERLNIERVKTEFLDSLHEIDNLQDLRDMLDNVSNNRKLSGFFRQEIAQLLAEFHEGQAHLSLKTNQTLPPATPSKLGYFAQSPTRTEQTLSSPTQTQPEPTLSFPSLVSPGRSLPPGQGCIYLALPEEGDTTMPARVVIESVDKNQYAVWEYRRKASDHGLLWTAYPLNSKQSIDRLIQRMTFSAPTEISPNEQALFIENLLSPATDNQTQPPDVQKGQDRQGKGEWLGWYAQWLTAHKTKAISLASISSTSPTTPSILRGSGSFDFQTLAEDKQKIILSHEGQAHLSPLTDVQPLDIKQIAPSALLPSTPSKSGFFSASSSSTPTDQMPLLPTQTSASEAVFDSKGAEADHVLAEKILLTQQRITVKKEDEEGQEMVKESNGFG